ncbi:hypothetical protein [Saccharopolyspora pogona]|uniref:hypothetical protein n=1 Tax=Saccharopolyspora pogona TaxID=333966 RepID=UPI001684472B|nr:hypothetical protein [Saccharopolyspora pogona]
MTIAVVANFFILYFIAPNGISLLLTFVVSYTLILLAMVPFAFVGRWIDGRLHEKLFFIICRRHVLLAKWLEERFVEPAENSIYQIGRPIKKEKKMLADAARSITDDYCRLMGFSSRKNAPGEHVKLARLIMWVAEKPWEVYRAKLAVDSCLVQVSYLLDLPGSMRPPSIYLPKDAPALPYERGAMLRGRAKNWFALPITASVAAALVAGIFQIVALLMR